MSQSDREAILEYVRSRHEWMVDELLAYEDACDDWAWGLRKDKPEPPKWLAEAEGETNGASRDA